MVVGQPTKIFAGGGNDIGDLQHVGVTLTLPTCTMAGKGTDTLDP